MLLRLLSQSGELMLYSRVIIHKRLEVFLLQQGFFHLQGQVQGLARWRGLMTRIRRHGGNPLDGGHNRIRIVQQPLEAPLLLLCHGLKLPQDFGMGQLLPHELLPECLHGRESLRKDPVKAGDGLFVRDQALDISVLQ